MYQELKKEDFIKDLAISPKDIPDALIIYGGYKLTDFIQEWLANNCHYRKNLFYTLHIGKNNNKNIAFIMAYGDSMASEIAHVFAKIGVKLIVIFGTFGALQKGVEFGDIFVPNLAISDDGASIKYNPTHRDLKPDPVLFNKTLQLILQNNLPHHVGPIISTSGILSETEKIINNWTSQGYFGVDLETAAVFSVAQSFRIPAISLLTLADNLVEKQTVFDVIDSNRVKKIATKNKMFNLALELIEEIDQKN